MKGLNGKIYRLDLKNRSDLQINSICSKGHKIARELLLLIYPFDPIYEEVPIKGCPTMLYLDFYIPNRKLVIEVQGDQHRKASSFFGGKKGFANQIKRDNNKKLWCEINNLLLVTLDDDRTDEWESAIRNCFLDSKTKK